MRIITSLVILLSISKGYAQEVVNNEAKPDASVASPAPASISSSQAGTGGQSTAKLAEDVKAAEAPKKFSNLVIFHNEAPMDTKDSSVNRQEADVRTALEYQLTYKIAPDQSISVYDEIDSSYGIKRVDGRADWAFSDPFIQYTRSNILKTDLGNLKAFIRFYVPTSESTRDIGYNTYGRLGVNWSKDVNKYLTLSYEFEPRFYSNTKSSFLSETSYGSGQYDRIPTSATGGLLQYASVIVNVIPDKLTLEQDLGTRRRFYNSDKSSSTEGVSKGMSETVFADTMIAYQINPTFGVDVGIDEDVNVGAAAPDLNNQKREFSLYRGDESIYYLEASATF